LVVGFMPLDPPQLRCALAIGGLDPGAGAGILADLRAFAAAGAYGCAAVALLTVQSSAGLRSARPVRAAYLVNQVREVIDNQCVRAVKVGALGSRENVVALARLLARHGDLPLVIDTPIAPSRGTAPLLSARALTVLREELLPLATLVTANAVEAQALTGRSVATVSEARDAAYALSRAGSRSVLVKGGHLRDTNAVDVLAIDGDIIELRARRLPLAGVHGTGCTLASLVAGRLALGPAARPSREFLIASMRWAKRTHHRELSRSASVGNGMRVLAF
jgi:hydroxymethylpyrimidine/phosphomethylpyrimidine kinase